MIQIFCFASSDSQSLCWSLPFLLCNHPGHTVIHVGRSISGCVCRHCACAAQVKHCPPVVRMTTHDRLTVTIHQLSRPLLPHTEPDYCTFGDLSLTPADDLLRKRLVLCGPRFDNGMQFPACLLCEWMQHLYAQ